MLVFEVTHDRWRILRRAGQTKLLTRRHFRMAQATRSSIPTADLSDDPIENVSSWLQTNQKPLLYGIVALAVAVGAIFLYRTNESSTREKASRALYEAQGPMVEGKMAEAASALEKVATRYSGTSSGDQASILLAQVLFDEKKYDAGLAALTKVQSSAGADFSASIEGTLAVGYEAQGKFAEAADHYGKAAGLAKFPVEKGQYQSSQARAFMSAGKSAEAGKLWLELSKSDNLSFSQEAQVRLGEIAGLKK